MSREDHHRYLEYNPVIKYTDRTLYNIIQKEFKIDITELNVRERNN